MRRIATTALLIVSLAAAGAAAKPKPKPKPPPPRLELLTTNQLGALQHKAIKVAVRARRAKEIRVKASFVVDGYPDDFYFRLGPETKKLKDREARVALPLSARKREVLDFAAQTCRPATVSLTAKAGKRTGTLNDNLKKPRDC